MTLDNLAEGKFTVGTIFIGISTSLGAMFDWVQDGGLTAILAAILTTVVIISHLMKIKREIRMGEYEVKRVEQELRIQAAKEKSRLAEITFRHAQGLPVNRKDDSAS